MASAVLSPLFLLSPSHNRTLMRFSALNNYHSKGGMHPKEQHPPVLFINYRNNKENLKYIPKHIVTFALVSNLITI